MVNNEVIFESVELVNRLYEESLYPLNESMKEFKHKVAKVLNQLYLKVMDFLDKSTEQITLAIHGATRVDKYLKTKPKNRKEVRNNLADVKKIAIRYHMLYPQWVELFDIVRIVHYCFDNKLIVDSNGQSYSRSKNGENIGKNVKYFEADKSKLKNKLETVQKDSNNGLYNPEDAIDIVIKEFFPEGLKLSKNDFLNNFYFNNSYAIGLNTDTIDTEMLIKGISQYYSNGKLEKLKTDLTKLKKMAREKYRNDLIKLKEDKETNKNEILRIKSSYITSMKFIAWYNAIWLSQLKAMNKLLKLSEVR